MAAQADSTKVLQLGASDVIVDDGGATSQIQWLCQL